MKLDRWNPPEEAYFGHGLGRLWGQRWGRLVLLQSCFRTVGSDCCELLGLLICVCNFFDQGMVVKMDTSDVIGATRNAFQTFWFVTETQSVQMVKMKRLACAV